MHPRHSAALDLPLKQAALVLAFLPPQQPQDDVEQHRQDDAQQDGRPQREVEAYAPALEPEVERQVAEPNEAAQPHEDEPYRGERQTNKEQPSSEGGTHGSARYTRVATKGTIPESPRASAAFVL